MALLIEVGKRNDPTPLLHHDPPTLDWDQWREARDGLTEHELVLLAKGLYLAAEQDLRWYGGSVTPIKGTLIALQDRGSDRPIVVFAVWALTRKHFYYGEFDWAHQLAVARPEFESLGSAEQERLIEKYRLEEANAQSDALREKAERYAAHVRQQVEERERRIQWSGSVEDRAAAYSIQLSQQQIPPEVRAQELAALDLLEPGERLSLIASRSDRTLMFYPARYALVDDDTLVALPPADVVSLFLKARHVQEGHWKTLQRQLASLGLLTG